MGSAGRELGGRGMLRVSTGVSDLEDSVLGGESVEGRGGKRGLRLGDGAGKSWAPVFIVGGNGAPGRRGPIGRWMIVVRESDMVC